MPKFTLVRTCWQYYEVNAASIEEAFEKYAAGEAVLESEETVDIDYVGEDSDDEE